MRSSTTLLTSLSVLATTAVSQVSGFVVPQGSDLQEGRHVAAYQNEMRRREIIGADGLESSYDFIICGGGVAGLVIASRLSEDQNKTVLVIEAGDTGDAVKSSIDVPGNAYYSSLLNTDYDWQYKTVPQTNLGNRVLDWPRGRVLGGSSAVNGLYLVRPSSLEVNTWAQLAGTNGSAWNWDSMFAAMKKSETFTPPTEEITQEFNIAYNTENHGTDGPLHYSYPGFLLPVVGEWTTVLENIGVNVSPDPNGGNGWGAFIATSSINPSNWTRSYSKSAYIDPLPPRANLHILPNARVLKVNTNSTGGVATATGIQYSMTGGDLTGRTITANKEVILTGGAIGSPHMLMMSGIGPKANLESVGVQSVLDLPGVGQHVTDHVASEVIFKTTANTAATDRINQTLTNGTESFFSFVNSAIAYANITDLFGDYAPEFRDTIARNLTWAVENVCPSTDPTVQAGYRAVHEAGTENFILSPIGHVELLLGLTGTAQGGDDSIAIQAALQHPFSTGQIYLNSSNPWEYPVIDPNYLAHPADTWLIREGLKLARKIGNTAPLSNFMTSEVFPGTQVQTDAEWDAWLATQVKTEYHPSSSCSMMPLDHGGVVGADLKVHGTTNLRVADSSVFPVQFAAHLQSLTYGVGEIASEMIKNEHMAVRQEISANTSTTAGATGTDQPIATSTGAPGTTTGTGSGSSNNQNSASSIRVSAAGVLAASVLALLALA